MKKKSQPKYYVLKKYLVDKINQEEYKSNDMIPSERHLTQLHNVSRITVRRAIEEMVNEGYLYKVQGKGTFVKTDKYTQDLISITSCTQDVLNLGMKPSRKVITNEVIKSDKKRQKTLEILENDDVFRLERIYYADKSPINHTTAYIPYKYFPGIEEYDFEKDSLYKILEEKYNVKITKAVRTVEARLATLEIARYLSLQSGTPVLLFCCVTYGEVNGKEVPIENFKCCYRSDRFKFYINQVVK